MKYSFLTLFLIGFILNELILPSFTHYTPPIQPAKTRQLQYKRHFYVPRLDLWADNVNSEPDHTLADRFSLSVLPGPTPQNPALLDLAFKYYAASVGGPLRQHNLDSFQLHKKRLQDPEASDLSTPHLSLTLRLLEIVEYLETNGQQGYQEGEDRLLQNFTEALSPLWTPNGVLPDIGDSLAYLRSQKEAQTDTDLDIDNNNNNNNNDDDDPIVSDLVGAWALEEYHDLPYWKFSSRTLGLLPAWYLQALNNNTNTTTNSSSSSSSSTAPPSLSPFYNIPPPKTNGTLGITVRIAQRQMTPPDAPSVQLGPNRLEFEIDVQDFPWQDPTRRSMLAWKIMLSTPQDRLAPAFFTDPLQQDHFSLFDDPRYPARPADNWMVHLDYLWQRLATGRLPQELTFDVPIDIKVRIHTAPFVQDFTDWPPPPPIDPLDARPSNLKHGHNPPNGINFVTWQSFIAPAPYTKLTWDPSFVLSYVQWQDPYFLGPPPGSEDTALGLGLGLGLGIPLLIALALLLLYYIRARSFKRSAHFSGIIPGQSMTGHQMRDEIE